MAVGLEEALTLLQNKVRREILERLVREPHYPLQLSQQIGVSQQAIMKHLSLLEKAGFVVSEMVPSEKGGPPKRIFAVRESFSMRIDLGPDLFRVEQRKLPKGGPMRISSALPSDVLGLAELVSGRRKIPLGEAMSHLSVLSEELDSLDQQRDAIIALHQHIRNRVSHAVDEEFIEYEHRRVMHDLLDDPRKRFDISRLREELQIGARQMEDILEDVRHRLLRQIGEERKGQIIAAPQNTSLPWWVLLDKANKQPSTED